MESRKEIVDRIEELLKAESVSELKVEVRELKEAYNEVLGKEHHEARMKFVEEGGQDADFKVPHDEEDTRFMNLMTIFRQRKKQEEDARAKDQEQNLLVKKKVIDDLNTLIKEEQNIGKAFAVFKELQETWKSTGNVPAGAYRDLQQEYSRALEEFFYNINVYKSLKAYDLKKNFELKQELIIKVKALQDHTSIAETRELIKTYVNEWDEIGPTEKDKWEAIRDEFWQNTRAVYARIQEHYKGLKENQEENLKLKEALCEKVEDIAAVSYQNPKKWNQKSKEMDAIRAEWKAIGFAGKKSNDAIWKRFRTGMNKFYDARKQFHLDMKEVFQDHVKDKERIIEEAIALQDSTDWKETTDKFIKLQKRWKEIGSAGAHQEQRLWKKFRAACDHFFNAKKHFFNTREDREGANLGAKNAVIDELKKFKLAGDKDKDLKSIAEFMVKWNSIGFVPAKEKAGLNKTFDAVLNEQLKAIGLKGSELDDAKFQFKVEGIKASDNSRELLRVEMLQMEDKMRKLEAEIKQYENNLGFIGGNTEGNPLVMEVEKKIEHSKDRLNMIRERIQMLRY